MNNSKILMQIMLTSSIFLSSSSMALEINVKDYFYKKEIGLFYIRPDIGDSTVYYVPQTVEAFRNTGKSVMIQDETYNVYEASVGFPLSTDLDQVRRLKPEWASAGFIRDDLETIDFCKVNRQATPEFNFYQQIDLIWKKQGFISSTSAFLCKVNIGIRPGDERTLTAMSILNQNSLLLNRGISTFTLKMTNPIETVLNLSPSFEYLNGINKSGLLVNLSRESAIVSLGVSFSKLDDASFAAIFNFIKKSGTEALLDRYFSVKMGFYSLNQVATETKLVIKGQSSVEFDL